MIATITGGILVLIGVILFIISIKIEDVERSEVVLVAGILPIILAIILFMLVVWNGYCFTRDLLEKKEKLELILEYDTSYYVVEKVIDYNEDVNRYNNYFYRFTIEDRGEWLIDIDKYLEAKENE